MKTFFVDESGDLGAKGKYFAIVLLAPQNSKRISNFMKRFCAKNNVDEVKGSNLSFPQRQDILGKLCSANDYTVSYIVANAVYAKYTYEKAHFYNMMTISESIKFPYAKFGSIPPVDKSLDSGEQKVIQ